MPAAATLQDPESKALALSEPERARLVGSLVRSFTDAGDSIFASWLNEAERRDLAMGDDPEAGAPADEVLRSARTRLG